MITFRNSPSFCITTFSGIRAELTPFLPQSHDGTFHVSGHTGTSTALNTETRRTTGT
jgi:hypothetical protein